MALNETIQSLKKIATERAIDKVVTDQVGKGKPLGDGNSAMASGEDTEVGTRLEFISIILTCQILSIIAKYVLPMCILV